MSLVDFERLREVAEVEFADIVMEAFVPDLWITAFDHLGKHVSVKQDGRYSDQFFPRMKRLQSRVKGEWKKQKAKGG